jgi:Prion-inhibition and propagation
MPFGIDEAIGVTALSLTALNGCIRSLTVLSKAKHYKRDISNVRLQIELEQHKLFTWAEAAGLTQPAPTLHMSVNDAEYVPKILRQLESFLSDLGRLKRRYQLDLDLTTEEVEALDDEDSTLSKLGPKLQEYTRRASSAVFLNRNKAWKRLRWVALDESQVGRLLTEVKSYTERLETFLDLTRKDEWRRGREADIRDAVLNSNDYQKLEILGRESQQTTSAAAMAAVTSLKQIRLKLELSDSSTIIEDSRGVETSGRLAADQKRITPLPFHLNSSNRSLGSMRLHIRLLTLKRAESATLRSLAYYDDKLVMLEWKSGSGFNAVLLENRVDNVAAFLNKLEPSLHSLTCRGYVKDREANRYGYVFDLPDKVQPRSSHRRYSQGSRSVSDPFKLRTLQELFEQSETVPSLNQRLSIATTLLETLLNLHTSGWLHKQFRSDNIIFIQNGDTEEISEFNISNYSIYGAGYGYARADDPGEMTEPLESEIESDLYRHPASLARPRSSFRRSFDIFSVSCTILEIGLWSRLSHILEQHSSRGWSPRGLGSAGYRSFDASSVFKTTPAASLKSSDTDCGESMKSRRSDSFDPSRDWMKLRHELLLSQLPMAEKARPGSVLSIDSFPHQSRCRILQSLAAVAGSAYTRLVERLLSVESINGAIEDTGNEMEDALVLELEAVRTIQAIAKAIE